MRSVCVSVCHNRKALPIRTAEDLCVVLHTVSETTVLCVHRFQFFQSIQNHFLAGFLHFSSQNEFVEDEIDFMKVEDEVQLADILKEMVQNLHEEMNRLQQCELVIGDITADGEEESSIALVYDLVCAEFGKVCARLGVPRDDEAMDFVFEFVFLGIF